MRRSTLLAAAASSLLAAGAAHAQELAVGQEVRGALTAEDPRTSEEQGGYRYDEFTVQGRAGDRLEAILQADEFDAYLEVFGAGDAETALAFDDDGLGDDTTNSRLRWTVPADGVYRLRARPLSEGEGNYVLSLKLRPPAPPAPEPDAIQVGQTVEGQIAAEHPIDDEGVPYTGYVFRARAGERIAIRLNAEDFDPIVRVGRRAGAFEALAENDDAGGGGLNSYLVFTAPEEGEYVVRAAPLREDGSGAYTLSLATAPPPVEPTVIAIGDTVEGELSAEDGVSEAGARADAYRFTGAEGQQVTIEMRSDAFDAYLELYRLTEAGREIVTQDDDGLGEGTDARLEATLPAASDYVVEARAFSPDPDGAYTLSIEETLPDPEPTPLAFGAELQGEIVDEDPRDIDGRGFDAFSFSGQEGQRVQVIMRSGDFDTYLQIGRPGETFEPLAQDDDGLMEGTDSRLNYTLPETGDYILRASPLGSGIDGLYALTLTDRGPQPAPGSLLIGATARGSLSEADALAPDQSFFDAYRVNLKAGEKLRITMVSNEFDSLVSIVRDGDDEGIEVLATDDDGLSDTHAKLEWAPDDDGVYVIRAGSFGPNQTGAYALTVVRKP